MERKEAIDVIFELCGAKTHKQAENHLGYLIRAGQIPDLKAGVRVIFAQNTTTRRSCIRVEQQLWWYIVFQFTWDELKRLNLPSEEYQSVMSHLTLNLDKTSVMGSEGTTKVIGDTRRKNQEKNRE